MGVTAIEFPRKGKGNSGRFHSRRQPRFSPSTHVIVRIPSTSPRWNLELARSLLMVSQRLFGLCRRSPGI